MNLKVAIIQSKNSSHNLDINLKMIKSYMEKAAENHADIVLLPECFLTGYYCPDVCKDLKPVQDIESHPDFIKWVESGLCENENSFVEVCHYAEKLGVGVVLTGFSKGQKYLQNSAWLIDKTGRVLLKYSKVHTCDFDWERYLESGTSFPVCEFDGVKIGIMICYDREYPESARELMLGGAEVILHPNCCSAMMPRLRELSVRAMENMVYIAMANPAFENAGNSGAWTPFVFSENGEPLDNTVFIGSELDEKVYYVDFDIDRLREYRNQEDLGKFRKPQAYLNQLK